MLNLKMLIKEKRNIRLDMATDKKLAIALIAFFVLLSAVIPHFSLLVVLIIGYLFFIELNKSKDYNFNEKALNAHQKLQKFIAFKKDYMQSYAWQAKRDLVLQRDHYKCVICDATGALHVHHLVGYRDIPNEKIKYLVTLCPKCHKKQHEVHGYPSTYEEYKNWNVKLVK